MDIKTLTLDTLKKISGENVYNYKTDTSITWTSHDNDNPSDDLNFSLESDGSLSVSDDRGLIDKFTQVNSLEELQTAIEFACTMIQALIALKKEEDVWEDA